MNRDRETRRVERQARYDYELYRGLDFYLAEIDAFWADTDRDDTFYLVPPARMRLIDADLEHWTDDNWLDPYWDFVFVGHHPKANKLRSCHWFGPSHCTDGEQDIGETKLRLANTCRNRLRLAWRLWRRPELKQAVRIAFADTAWFREHYPRHHEQANPRHQQDPGPA